MNDDEPDGIAMQPITHFQSFKRLELTFKDKLA